MARKLLSKPVCNLLQATNLIPFSHNENSLLFCELLHKVFWQFKSASTVTRCIAIGYFSEVSLVRINCMDLLVVSHPYKVSLKGNITKINTNTKDQETVKGTSVGHNNDTSPQSYTLTLVNKMLNLKDLVQSQIVNLFSKCLCSLTDVVEPTFLGTVGTRR